MADVPSDSVLEIRGTDVGDVGDGGEVGDVPRLDSGPVDPCETSLGVPCDQVVGSYFKASNAEPGDFFGNAVSISGDTLAVGARREAGGVGGVDNDPTDNSEYTAGAVYVFQRTGAVWEQQAYIKASNPDDHDWFGESVSLHGDTLAVGAPGESSDSIGVGGNEANNSAANSGAAYVFRRTGSVWAQQAYLKASNTNATDDFGRAVSVYGDALAVGAPQEGGDGSDPLDNSSPAAGAVYVFRRTGTTWTEEAYLKASDAEPSASFGRSVSLHQDRLAIGACAARSLAGAVYVFERAGLAWTQQADMVASNPDTLDRFGEAVSLHGDWLAVGAPNEDSRAQGLEGDQTDESMRFAGAVYLFERLGSGWEQRAYVKASNTREDFRFGASVSLEGSTLVVGAYNEDGAGEGVNGSQSMGPADSGAAYVFRRDGAVWTQRAYLKAPNPDAGDNFGVATGLSNGTLVVGAFAEASSSTGVDGPRDDDSTPNTGAAYVYLVGE